MNHIDSKLKQYRLANSKLVGNIDYMTCHNLFYYYKYPNIYLINISALILSKWLREEFIEFINISKGFKNRRRDYKYFNDYKYCLDDLEKNLDKYLNEAIIKSIIE